jgi:hypothetical protein
MLNEEHRRTGSTRPSGDAVDAIDHFLPPDGSVFPFAEVLLDVDDEQRRVHMPDR